MGHRCCAMCVPCYDTLRDCGDITRGAGEGERNVWAHEHKLFLIKKESLFLTCIVI